MICKLHLNKPNLKKERNAQVILLISAKIPPPAPPPRGRMIHGSHTHPDPNSWMLLYTAKGIKLRILRGRVSWITQANPKYNQKCPYDREAEGDFTMEEKAVTRQSTECFEDTILLVLNVEEGAMSQGMRGMKL